MSLREQLLKKLSKQAVCCEIGVDKGDFSQELLQITKPEEIHLIDPWDYFEDPKYVKSRYGGKKGVSKENMNNRYNDVIKRFSKNKNVIIHRGYSKDILSKFPDAFFDWIYIDGNHTYDFVYSDLILSCKKVKIGGIIAGDDYIDGKWWKTDVIDAVNDFIRKNNKKLQIIGTQFIIQN